LTASRGNDTDEVAASDEDDEEQPTPSSGADDSRALLAAHPHLGGKAPVEVGRQKPSPDVLDRLYLLAQHAGEMDT
jgi:hypothetical protein